MNGAADATVAREAEQQGVARAGGAGGEGPAHRRAGTPLGAEPAWRQARAAPFSKGSAKESPNPLGRKPGTEYVRQATRPIPAKVDEHPRRVPSFLSPLRGGSEGQGENGPVPNGASAASGRHQTLRDPRWTLHGLREDGPEKASAPDFGCERGRHGPAGARADRHGRAHEQGRRALVRESLCAARTAVQRDGQPVGPSAQPWPSGQKGRAELRNPES